MKFWQLRQWAKVAQSLQFWKNSRSIKKSIPLFVIGAMLSLTIAACNYSNASTPANRRDVELTLVGYAVPKAAYDQIAPKFAEQWKKQNGQTVDFNHSFGGSGTQTRAIVDGLEADIAHLALAADTNKLVKAGLVNPNWRTQAPNNGIVAKSVIAIAVRPGNPKNIKTLQDLARDDVKWVTPDPKTSGGARWNFMALWNDALKRNNGEETKAKESVAKAYKNIAVLSRDAREAADAFVKQGQGDALINYENEVILAKQKGAELDYITPEINISIDTPIALIDRNVDKHGTREVAEAFVKFLFTPEAQAEFVKLGFRPSGEAARTKENLDKFPAVKTLATIKDFGGWSEVQQKFFEDGAVFDQTIAAAKQSQS